MNSELILGIVGIIFSFIAGIVGICALAVSIWQGMVTSRNVRLSVQPYLSIVGNWAINDKYFGIYIGNKGIGPAKITSIKILYQGKWYDFLSRSSEFLHDLTNNLKEINISKQIVYIFDPGEYIAEGEIIPFIYLVDPEIPNGLLFFKNLHGLEIRLKYQSIYDKTYQAYYTTAPLTPVDIEAF